jgi:uncharacterized RDD family membrane protein YckC/DNA-binding HxlR family transcriptional regulator
MVVDQSNVSKVLSVIAHRIRREILLILSEKGETSFTDLMNALKIDTGKLSFHMRSLGPFIEQTENGKYKLNRAGENAVRVIHDVESWTEAADVNGKAPLLPLASSKQRIEAFLIDFTLILTFASFLVVQLFFIPGVYSWAITLINLLVIDLVILFAYSTMLEGFSGQTLGKNALGLKVVQTDGRKLSYGHAAVRNFGKIILPLDLVFGYMENDPRFLRYFDKFAGTTVIDLRKHLTEKSSDLHDS